MERKIGEIFEYNGEWYQCVRGQSEEKCTGCFFKTSPICIDLNCLGNERKDHTKVIFKKLEKVGEPYTTSNDKVMQNYLTETEVSEYPKDVFILTNYRQRIIAIEIKQNEEDMEEKKPTYEELLHYYHSTVGLWAIDKNPREVSLDWICDNAFQLGIDEKDSNSENIGKNLREFNLEAAKAGKPVCTRDGRKARIICFDRNDLYPIVALIECEDGKEMIGAYSKEGQTEIYEIKGTNLMMLPEKKEGWVNIVRGSNGKSHMGRGIFQSKEEAEYAIKEFSDNLIDTIKVSWEE